MAISVTAVVSVAATFFCSTGTLAKPKNLGLLSRPHKKKDLEIERKGADLIHFPSITFILYWLIFLWFHSGTAGGGKALPAASWWVKQCGGRVMFKKTTCWRRMVMIGQWLMENKGCDFHYLDSLALKLLLQAMCLQLENPCLWSRTLLSLDK